VGSPLPTPGSGDSPFYVGHFDAVKQYPILEPLFVEGLIGVRQHYFGIAIRRHNEINEEVARRMAVPFVEEATDETIFPANLFWDFLHFNEAVSRVMAKLMAEWLCARPDLIHEESCTAARR
jgi:hypothetical protein